MGVTVCDCVCVCVTVTLCLCVCVCVCVCVTVCACLTRGSHQRQNTRGLRLRIDSLGFKLAPSLPVTKAPRSAKNSAEDESGTTALALTHTMALALDTHDGFCYLTHTSALAT